MNASSETGAGVASARDLYEACRERVRAVVMGQDAAFDAAFVALITGGHALLEGVPGLAKTLLVRTIAATLDAEFGRVQFTVDLMPSDVTGSVMLQNDRFEFRPGPVFTDLLLADEINRAPAKTQSALLEAMQERTVTADGTSHRLPELFTVFATQNPIEHEGTYPLPEAELDRFMMMIRLDYPDEAAERAILAAHHASASHVDLSEVSPVSDRDGVRRVRQQVRDVSVSDEVLDYVARLVRATRAHLSVAAGCSPRAGLELVRASKGGAAIEGRDFVTPDDVKRWSQPVLQHRLVLVPGAEIGGADPAEVIDSVMSSTEVPT